MPESETNQATDETIIIDVRRRKRAFAITEHERLYLRQLLTEKQTRMERLRDEMKVIGVVIRALFFDGEARKARLLLEALQ